MEARILKIDLSNKTYEIEEIPGEVLRKYIGGRGLGSYFLYKLVPAKADPLGAENHLIFTGGPANGTDLYYSSKFNVNTKSPLTNIYLHSLSSGILGHQLKKAGLWALDIKGIAGSPTYIIINNQNVEFKDAVPIWGVEAAEAQRLMLGGLSEKKAATVAIGPAGEQLVKYAAIFSQGPLYRCLGRGGAGCVMGSKKLKGIIITGDGKVEIPDKVRFDAVKKNIVSKLETDARKWADRWRRYETASDLQLLNELGMLPTRNWQTGQFEGWRGIDKSTTPMGWPEKSRTCGPYCPTAGCRDVEVKEGPYKGTHSDIEWETIYAFGTTCGVDKMEAIIAASQICDEFGIDTMTTGITIGFAMECFERGLIGLKDTDGIELRFGNDEAMITMLKKLVDQEGFGKQLAKGTKRLSEEIKGSEAFAMHVKGLELGGYECRGLNGQALQFAVSNRGGCHHSYGLPARREIFDDTRLDVEGKGEQFKNIAIDYIIRDCLPSCAFAMAASAIDIGNMAEALSSLFGQEWSIEHLNEVSLRIMCQERLFNMREGITRKDDTLPARLLNEPKPDGPTQGAVVPLEELKEEFYRTMGYDLSTGNPTDSLIDKLEIER